MPRTLSARVVLIAACLILGHSVVAETVDVWIGTTRPASGIYHLTFDEASGELSGSTLAAEVDGAGFLAKHPRLPVVYSTAQIDGEGSVVAWRIVRDGEATRLERINSRPTGDGGAAHVAVDRTGAALLSAQYGGGSVASFPLNEDGSIGERASLLEHDDPSGIVPDRQASCHPHWVGVSPDNRFVLVPDLGADRIYLHRFDAATAELTPSGSVTTQPGGGPRHFAFHPDGTRGYVVNEITVALSSFDYDPAGRLTLRQTIPALSEGQKAKERHKSGSEVRVHPSGRFVYSANRGHDSITAFAIDPSSGELTMIEQEPIRGSWPRNFNLSPSGGWLLAAGRDSNTLAVFAIDQATGELEYTLETASVPAPICVLMGDAN